MWHPFDVPSPIHPSRSRPSPRRRALRPRLESLEGRVVLSAAFDSVLRVGSDTASHPAQGQRRRRRREHLCDRHPLRGDGLRPGGRPPRRLRHPHPAGHVGRLRRQVRPRQLARLGPPDGQRPRSPAASMRTRGATASASTGPGTCSSPGTSTGRRTSARSALTSAGDSDAFVTKLDPDGNILWAKGWGGATQDVGMDIAVDAAGNVVSVGTTATVDSDGGLDRRTGPRCGSTARPGRPCGPSGSTTGRTAPAAWRPTRPATSTCAASSSGTVGLQPRPQEGQLRHRCQLAAGRTATSSS